MTDADVHLTITLQGRTFEVTPAADNQEVRGEYNLHGANGAEYVLFRYPPTTGLVDGVLTTHYSGPDQRLLFLLQGRATKYRHTAIRGRPVLSDCKGFVEVVIDQ